MNQGGKKEVCMLFLNIHLHGKFIYSDSSIIISV